MTDTLASTQPETMTRSALQAQVDTRARCAGGVDPSLFFHEDGPDPTWPYRRAEALQVCAACPVVNACRELALRNGDGTSDADDMVRGGMTGRQLAQARRLQADRLIATAAAETDAEWNELADLVRSRAELIHQGLGRHRPSGVAHAAQVARLEARDNEQIAVWADRISEIRTVRRARTGWGIAARADSALPAAAEPFPVRRPQGV